MSEVALEVKFDFSVIHQNKRILSIPSHELESNMTILHWHRRNFIPCSSIKITASSLRCTASPLLMEKSNILSQTAVTEITHPIGVAKTVPKSALPTGNQPVNSIKT